MEMMTISSALKESVWTEIQEELGGLTAEPPAHYESDIDEIVKIVKQRSLIII